jgi:dTDP-3,4-didehydro-2,6-dideoxy-alpha-D-glucose 3-reductase
MKNLGIIGCANITQVSIINPLKSIDTIGLYGVASSSKNRAMEFAAKYEIPNIYNSYSDLLKDNNIDFVYIALSNNLHSEWCINSANAGKHIIVEKPASLKYEDFKEVKNCCERNNVKLLEAIMVQHHPWQKYLTSLVKSKKYGNLKTITTSISFVPRNNFKDNYRTVQEAGGGVFFDLAPYWLQFLQCFGSITEAVYSGESGFDGPNGCDWTFNSKLIFTSGIKCFFEGSFEKPYKVTHELEFENAVIKMNDFYRANFGNLKVSLSIFEKEKGSEQKVFFEPQNYYVNQLNYFLQLLDGIQGDDTDKTLERILILEKIYESARHKCGRN